MTSLEFTTQIGCSVNCLKYCPQEVITRGYIGQRKLSLSMFKDLINDVPTECSIIFSGVCEPFLNQECPDMILWASRRGHSITVFSTLVGLTTENANRIKDVPFERFTLHLPDSRGISYIPETDTYCKVLNIVLRNVERLWFMNMGCYFIDDHSEDLVRWTYQEKPVCGRVTCNHLVCPDYIVLPNGNVYFCCQTKGQTELVGNLFEETYQELLSKHSGMAKRMSSDRDSICHKCSVARPYWLHPIRQLFGEKLIAIGKRYFT